MKKFSFPLERVLRWRHSQAQLEEAKLDQIRAQIRGLEQQQAELGRSVEDARAGVLGSSSLSRAEFAALEHYRAAAQGRDAQLTRMRQKLRQDAERQLLAVMERRREAKLLERLQEKRLAEWQAAQALEVEQAAAESFLARHIRESPL